MRGRWLGTPDSTELAGGRRRLPEGSVWGWKSPDGAAQAGWAPREGPLENELSVSGAPGLLVRGAGWWRQRGGCAGQHRQWGRGTDFNHGHHTPAASRLAVSLYPHKKRSGRLLSPRHGEQTELRAAKNRASRDQRVAAECGAGCWAPTLVGGSALLGSGGRSRRGAVRGQGKGLHGTCGGGAGAEPGRGPDFTEPAGGAAGSPGDACRGDPQGPWGGTVP